MEHFTQDLLHPSRNIIFGGCHSSSRPRDAVNDTTKLCRSAVSEGTIQFGNLGNLRYTPPRLPSPHAFFFFSSSLWHIVRFLLKRKIKRHVGFRRISCKHPRARKDHSDCLPVTLSLNCQLLPHQPKSTPGPRRVGMLGCGHKTDLDVHRRVHGSSLQACCWLPVSHRSHVKGSQSSTLTHYSSFPRIVSAVLSSNPQSKPLKYLNYSWHMEGVFSHLFLPV